MSIQIDLDKVIQAMRAYGMNEQANALQNGTAALGTACEIAGYRQQDGSTAVATKTDCGCSGGAQQQSTALMMRDTTSGTDTGGGIVPVWNLPGAAPACYSRCTAIDKCLVPLLREARSRFDDHAWMQLWIRDPSVLHFLDVASAASGSYLAAFPLTSNGRIILAQEAAQQLPFLPGYFKFNWSFSVQDAKDKVIVRIFTGPRGLTGLTGTTALVQIGNDLKLSDFDCHDDCYFLAYPDLLGCQSNGIPDTRQIYIELQAEALGGGGNQLDSVNLSMLKRGSKKYVSECNAYKLEMY